MAVTNESYAYICMSSTISVALLWSLKERPRTEAALKRMSLSGGIAATVQAAELTEVSDASRGDTRPATDADRKHMNARHKVRCPRLWVKGQ